MMRNDCRAGEKEGTHLRGGEEGDFTRLGDPLDMGKGRGDSRLPGF